MANDGKYDIGSETHAQQVLNSSNGLGVATRQFLQSIIDFFKRNKYVSGAQLDSLNKYGIVKNFKATKIG